MGEGGIGEGKRGGGEEISEGRGEEGVNCKWRLTSTIPVQSQTTFYYSTFRFFNYHHSFIIYH